MDLWTFLLDILVLVAVAFLLGSGFERIGLSAILGYLLAGTLLGPNALNLMPSHEAVGSIAELGVALLLFTIGLEFSWQRLRRMGGVALGGGSLQVVVTGALASGVCRAFGVSWPASIAVGAVVALSSTAAVLRLLISRGEIDSVHGRNALGILLMQDVLVVPLSLLITALGAGALIFRVDWETARFIGLAASSIILAFLLLRYVIPVFLSTQEAARNRDLAILLAVIAVIGAAWGSHELGMSPALGAFIAGLVVAGSPFATQIRADVGPLRTLFMTLFFSSIGTQANPTWALEHWLPSLGVIIAIVVGKTLVTSGVTLLFHASPGHALATGICLAQVGEFSFVLAEIAHSEAVIDDVLLQFLITATIGTLFLSPFLLPVAPRAALWAGKLRGSTILEPHPTELSEKLHGHVVIVGFGPAGQGVAETLGSTGAMVVVDLSSKTAAVARSYGLPTILGDARSEEVLEAAHVEGANAVVVTVPDPDTVRRIVERVRALAPEITIVARARYHVHRWQLLMAGASEVVDEEQEVGVRIAETVRDHLSSEE